MASYSQKQPPEVVGMQEVADKRLVKRILDGDELSFNAFFTAYYPRLFRFALVRLDNDRDLADETAQVVLCQALSKMDTYRGEAPLFSWLCTFCRYEVSKQRKARQRAQGDKPLVEDDPAVQAALDSLLAASSADPDAAIYQAEIRRLIKVALDYLPSMYADILEAKYVRDMSVKEIAEMVGKSPKATESILTRARSAFKDAFQTLMREEKQLRDSGSGLSTLLEF